MAQNDVANTCKSSLPTKFGGIVVGVSMGGRVYGKQETYDYKNGVSAIPTMTPSGNYTTGGPDLSGVAIVLSRRFDHPTYYG